MPYSPPPTPPRSLSSFGTGDSFTTSPRSMRSSSSLGFSSSRMSELLTKFPSPPQGRNQMDQIGLFPAIYTLPYQTPGTTTSETRPLSPESFVNNKARISADSEGGVYEGLGIHSDQVFAVDRSIHSADTDIEEVVANLSIKSSNSSILSSEIHRQEVAMAEESVTEDDSSSSSTQSNNPVLAQIKSWTPEDVAAFMVDRGFRNHAHNFIRHEITGSVLLELDLVMLKEVDIIPFGIRFGIMREIDGLKKLAGAGPQTGRTPALSLRTRSRADSNEEETDSFNTHPRTHSRQQFSPRPKPQYTLTPPLSSYRQSIYESSSIPRSDISPQTQSVTPDVSQDRRTSRLFANHGHRSTRSTDSGFAGSNFGTPDLDHRPPSTFRGHYRSSSVSTGMDSLTQQLSGRIRVDSSDSGLGHSRHTSTDTVIRSPGGGHRRQSSSLATVRVLPPSVPLMEAVSKGSESPKDLGKGMVVLPGTRVETPPAKSRTKFVLSNFARSQVTENQKGENGVRLVKSYSALRRRSGGSITSPKEATSPATDLHSHRSVLLKNIPAKEAALTADYCGWLKKRTERGTSIAGITVGPGTGVIGGWKRRWFVLKGRRLSYYHSEKVHALLILLTDRT